LWSNGVPILKRDKSIDRSVMIYYGGVHNIDVPKAASNVSLQTLLPTAALGAVRTMLTTKYNIEGRREEITHVAAAKPVKGIQKEIDEIIIPILKNDKNIQARFNLVLGMIGWVQSQMIPKAFEGGQLQKDVLVELAKTDLQGYEYLKSALSQTPHLRPDTTQRIIQIIDNLWDYENTIIGIAIDRQDRLEEALTQVDVEDFRNKLVDTILAFVFTLVIIVVKEFDEEILSKILTLGIKCSEEIESYVDTLDILSDRRTLESIRKSEEYYSLT